MVTYTTLGSSIQLNCSVRSFPVISIKNIQVYHIDSYLDSDQIGITQSEEKVDEVLIQLMFDKISVTDFGIYRMEVDNGVGEMAITEMEIKEEGGCVLFVFHKYYQVKYL